MSYYLGQSVIPVKPVARRLTFTRGMPQAVRQAYLQRLCRRPINRRGYPVTGMPIAAGRTRVRPGWLRGTMMGTATDLDLSREPGQDQLGAETPAGYGLAPLSLLQSTPAIPSVVTTPAPPPSGGIMGFITGLVDSWNTRPQTLKNIKVRINPRKVMAAAQQVVSPQKAGEYIEWLKSKGINVDYRGVPIGGTETTWGYKLGSIDWQSYLPWILGGGAILLLAPMLMGRRK